MSIGYYPYHCISSDVEHEGNEYWVDRGATIIPRGQNFHYYTNGDDFWNGKGCGAVITGDRSGIHHHLDALSVQVFASDKQKNRLHPTQKPIELLKYFIRTYTNKGDIVLDNTAGSGDIIASIDLIKVLGTQTFDAPFSNGLTIVTSGSPKITVTYE